MLGRITVERLPRTGPVLRDVRGSPLSAKNRAEHEPGTRLDHPLHSALEDDLLMVPHVGRHA